MEIVEKQAMEPGGHPQSDGHDPQDGNDKQHYI